MDYLHLLEDWKVRYAPKTPDDDLDDRFVEACQMIDYIEYLAFGVQSIPTLLFCPMKNQPQIAAGFMDKATLQKAIKEVLLVK